MRFNKVYEFKAANDGIVDMAFCENFLFTCAKDDYVRKWNSLNFSLLAEIKAHDKDVRILKFFPDLKSFLTSSEDGDIKEFDIQLNFIRDYKPHATRVNDIDFIDDLSFVTASDDGLVRIYRRGSSSFKEKNFKIGDVEAVSYYKRFILAGGSKLVIADEDLNEYMSFDDDYLYGVDGIYPYKELIFISRSMEKKLEIRDGDFKIVNVYKMPSWINDIKFIKDYIFCAVSNVIYVFDKNMNEVAKNDYYEAEIYDMEFFGEKLFCGYDDGFIRVWQIM